MRWNMLNAIALLLLVTAALAYFNHYVLRLPRNLGLLALALALSISLRIADQFVSSQDLIEPMRRTLARIDFPNLLLNGALPFLLFAGAIEVELKPLMESKWTILALATVGVLLSTAFIGTGCWAVLGFFGITAPLPYCLAFGALISPTDPVTVLGTLRRTALPPRLNAIIAGESMFNDAIGIALFAIFLSFADGQAGDRPSPFLWGAVEFVREAAGGAVLGSVTGGIAFFAMRGIDEYGIELIISLALVAGTYGLGQTIGVSGPVAVIVAGLIMGSVGVQYAVSGTTHDYLSRFWRLVDELLNAVLYLLMGFEFAVVTIGWREALAALVITVLAVVARALSVAVPGLPLHLKAPRKARALAVITWSGLRGGISLALALSLPQQPIRAPLIAAAYAVVVFTMLVQGLTLHNVVNRLYPPADKGHD